MELLLVDLCKDTVLKRPTSATTTTAGAMFDVPTFGLFRSKNRPNIIISSNASSFVKFSRLRLRRSAAPKIQVVF